MIGSKHWCCRNTNHRYQLQEQPQQPQSQNLHRQSQSRFRGYYISSKILEKYHANAPVVPVLQWNENPKSKWKMNYSRIFVKMFFYFIWTLIDFQTATITKVKIVTAAVNNKPQTFFFQSQDSKHFFSNQQKWTLQQPLQEDEPYHNYKNHQQQQQHHYHHHQQQQQQQLQQQQQQLHNQQQQLHNQQQQQQTKQSHQHQMRRLMKGSRRRRLAGEEGGIMRIFESFEAIWTETSSITESNVQTACIKRDASASAGVADAQKKKKKKKKKMKKSSNSNGNDADSVEDNSNVSNVVGDGNVTSSNANITTTTESTTVPVKNITSPSSSSSSTSASSPSTSSNLQEGRVVGIASERPSDSPSIMPSLNIDTWNTSNTAAADTVTLDSYTVNKTNNNKNNRRINFLRREQLQQNNYDAIENVNYMSYRQLQTEEPWVGIVGKIINRDNSTNKTTINPSAPPFTAAPLLAPFSAAPLASPFATAPVALERGSPVATMPTASSSVITGTIFPTTAAAAAAGQAPYGYKTKSKSPKGASINTDTAISGSDSVSKTEKYKKKDKKSKKLPYCDDLNDANDDDDVEDKSNANNSNNDDPVNNGSSSGDSNDDETSSNDDIASNDNSNNDDIPSNDDTKNDDKKTDDGLNDDKYYDDNYNDDNNPAVIASTSNPSNLTSDTSTIPPSDRSSTSAPSNRSDSTDRADICKNFFANAPIPSDASNMSYMIGVRLLLEPGSDKLAAATTLGAVLNERIAPALLGCDSSSGSSNSLQRQLQQSASNTTGGSTSSVTESLSIKFDTPVIDETGGSCPAASTVVDCVPITVDSTISFYGAKPTSDYTESLKRAILFWNWDEITGYRGIDELEVTRSDSNSGGGGNGDNGNNSGSGSDVVNSPSGTAPGATPIAPSVAPPTDDGATVSSAQGGNGGSGGSGGGVNTGAFVAVGIAAVTLLLLALFVLKRRSVQSKHAKHENGVDAHMNPAPLTDDELDDENMQSQHQQRSMTIVSREKSANRSFASSNVNGSFTDDLDRMMEDDIQPHKSRDSSYNSRYNVNHSNNSSNKNNDSHNNNVSNDTTPLSYVLSEEEDDPDNVTDRDMIAEVNRNMTKQQELRRKGNEYGGDYFGTEVTAVNQKSSPLPNQTAPLSSRTGATDGKGTPTMMLLNGSSSLDDSASSYYRYPARHIVSHRITSYDSEFKRVNELNNSRSYTLPDDTVDL